MEEDNSRVPFLKEGLRVSEEKDVVHNRRPVQGLSPTSLKDDLNESHEIIHINTGDHIDTEGTSPLTPWFLNPEFSDVTLYVGQNSSAGEEPTPITSFPIPDDITYCSIPAHRICLSRISPYFKACLTSSFEEAKDKKIHLQDNPQVFLILLKALYTNKIVLRRANGLSTDIVKVLQIADRYQCESVVQVVKKYIEEQFTTLEGATKIGSGIVRPPINAKFQDLIDLVLKTLTQDFDKFISSLKDLCCSERLLQYVLRHVHTTPDSRSACRQVSAIDLFNGLVEWADVFLEKKRKREGMFAGPSIPKPMSNKCPQGVSKDSLMNYSDISNHEAFLEERRRLLTPMIDYVKFYQMTPIQLLKRVKPAKLIPQEQLFDLLSEAVLSQEEVVRVIEFIGTCGYKQPFINPHPMYLTVTASSTKDDPKGVVGLVPANFWTDHDTDDERRIDPFVEIDFQTRRVIPRCYQFSVLGSCVPMRNWNLEGWCEQSNTWDILKEHKNDISFPDYDEFNYTCRWDLPWTDRSYRRIRIRCTAPNFDDFKDVVLCCLEIIGKIV